MTQRQLAGVAFFDLSTVKTFESGVVTPIANNRAALQAALEAAGVEFIPENGGGPGVRLRKPQKQK